MRVASSSEDVLRTVHWLSKSVMKKQKRKTKGFIVNNHQGKLRLM